jgi:hypothetical protein
LTKVSVACARRDSFERLDGFLIDSRSVALNCRNASAVTAAFVFVTILVFRWRLTLLIAQVQDTAIAVFINAIEPAAPQRVVKERVVVLCVVAENPGRAEAIAKYESLTKDLLADPSIAMADDDRSSTYAVLMDARTTPQAVSVRGITRLTPKRVQEMADQGKTVRLISRGRRTASGLSLRVRAEVLDRNDILACTPGTSNLILFHSDLMGTFGTVSIEPGVEQTAYGVFSDLVSLR